MTKTITVEQLKPGMRVVRLDQPWWRTPFWRHRFTVRTGEEIARLKASGVRQVVVAADEASDSASLVRTGAEPPAASSPDPPPPSPASPALDREVNLVREVRREAVSLVNRVFERMKSGWPPDVPLLQRVVDGFFAQLFNRPIASLTLIQLQQMKRVNRDMFGHAVDVCALSLIVGKAHGLDEPSLYALGLGALLHDVGELRLPQNLFQKPGALTDQERALIELHPRLGLAMLRETTDLPDGARSIVGDHHERLDGSGYPNGLRGGQCTTLAQLVGIVDVYDAMASGRDGRPPLLPSQAVRQLYHLGQRRHFDSALVERMIQCLGVYPFGSLVELNTGERAVVYSVNPEERLKPAVKLIAGADGRPYDPPFIVDLSCQDGAGPVRLITRVLDATQEGVEVARYCEA